jgi:hypothetical protein
VPFRTNQTLVLFSKGVRAGRKQIFTWLDENDIGRRAAWLACLAARPRDIAPWLFCTGEGEPYVDPKTWRTTSFNLIWNASWSPLERDSDEGAVGRARGITPIE